MIYGKDAPPGGSFGADPAAFLSRAIIAGTEARAAHKLRARSADCFSGA